MRSVNEVLWAKSKRSADETPPTVQEHCLAVRDAATAIWSATKDEWRRALGEHAGAVENVEPALCVAALLHDLGKANSAFQTMVQRGKDGRKQPVRHEALSALIAASDDIAGGWLSEALDEDFWAVVWAVGGHHLQFRKPRFGEMEDPLVRSAGVGNENVTLWLGHDEVTCVLQAVLHVLREAGHPVPRNLLPMMDRSFSTDEDADDYIGRPVSMVRNAQRQWRKCQRDDRYARRAAILKAMLMAADVAGSATLAHGDTESRNGQPFEKVCHDLQESLAARITNDDLAGIVGHVQLRGFQRTVAASDAAVTVVEAGCGNGKTTAAYLWAQRRAIGRKLFFCYPTTGTTSAGYSEYLDDQERLKRDLLHGRAVVDRLDLRTSADDDPTDLAHKAEALRAWGKQVIACTVDQVVGLVQNNRRPLFASPAIICGAFVFDEVHCYDERLFRELLRFLETFPGVPTLLMSASIPPARREALRAVLGARMGEPIPGDEHLQAIRRHRLDWRDDTEGCWADVAHALAADRKVLWVCNTVADAVAVFREAAERVPDARRLLYHSRFRYGGDPNGTLTGRPITGRVERQNQVIGEFAYTDDAKSRRLKPGPSLAVTTQVCEMSLDLDADLLVTALCPLSALVQRLGRLHRFADRNDPNGDRPRLCVVYRFDGRPYHTGAHPHEMTETETLLAERSGEPLSQRDLAKRMAALRNVVHNQDPIYSAWLDGGWQSESLPTREGSNSLTLVRSEDVEQTAEALGKPAWRLQSKEIIPLTIPMLVKRGFTPNGRVAGYPVAPNGSIEYSEEEGASWVE
jgi:CRISPR-associated endonuclease/helicase Cas3